MLVTTNNTPASDRRLPDDKNDAILAAMHLRSHNMGYRHYLFVFVRRLDGLQCRMDYS